jgi:hypothetical protein
MGTDIAQACGAWGAFLWGSRHLKNLFSIFMDWRHAGHMKCAQASFPIFGVKELIFGTKFAQPRILVTVGYLWVDFALAKYDHTITQLEKLSEKRERESTLFHWRLFYLRNPVYTSSRWREEEKLLRGLSQPPFRVAHSRTCGCFLQSNGNGFDLRYHKSAPRSVL